MFYLTDPKEILITIKHYVYLLVGMTLAFLIDFFMFPKLSMWALYSVPLVLAGVYFSRTVASFIGLLSWLFGLIDESEYLGAFDLLFRYSAIAVLVITILVISFNLKKQTQSLQQKTERFQDLVLTIIQSLSSAIEAKDQYLKGHSKNVANIAKKVALKLKVPSKEINYIYYAALLHDIGKIGIPEAILNKPDRLTEKEYNLVKKHCEVGANILSQLKEFEPFISYIKCHHERWDGLGYPHGFAGEKIPLGARIVAIADAFDAMTSQRSYKESFSIAQAVEEIKDCSGKQFDPCVVSAFLECHDYLKEKEEECNLTSSPETVWLGT